MSDHQAVIEDAWERRDELDHQTAGAVREAVEISIRELDEGKVRIAERGEDGGWTVNEWLKQAVLLSFRLRLNTIIPGASGGESAFDKVQNKFAYWTQETFHRAGFRVVPGAIVRRGAHVARNCVLMPSFVNIGAYIDEGTMVDAWATVGSCAQIGRNVHISGGAGIGGVLEPLQANPVIIEDNVFVGARSEVAEGVVVREGAVLSMGVYLGASTKIVDRESGEVTRGEVPPYAVVVPGTLPGAEGKPGLYCAVIVKKVDEQTRAKTAINELLRD